MEKVVITGKGSYIGSHIKEWLEDSNNYDVQEVDVEQEKWRMYDFSGVKTVVHVAGIVHQPHISDWDLYKKVNVDLPIEIANRAKQQGVKQFIFLSTMAVYGGSKRLRKNVISFNTSTNPTDMYGQSKLMAENQLKQMEDKCFKIVIVRPPNVYGKGCKGNYISKFTDIVKKLPVIPDVFIDVKQSMIYIDNLSNFIKLLIDEECAGVYMPQDREPVSTVELIEAISMGINRPLKKSKFMGIGIHILKWLPIIRKAYGGIEYDVGLSQHRDKNYIVIEFEAAIQRTVSET